MLDVFPDPPQQIRPCYRCLLPHPEPEKAAVRQAQHAFAETGQYGFCQCDLAGGIVRHSTAEQHMGAVSPLTTRSGFADTHSRPGSLRAGRKLRHCSSRRRHPACSRPYSPDAISETMRPSSPPLLSASRSRRAVVATAPIPPSLAPARCLSLSAMSILADAFSHWIPSSRHRNTSRQDDCICSANLFQGERLCHHPQTDVIRNPTA